MLPTSASQHVYITPEEELVLVVRAQAGDTESRNRLVENNLPLISFTLARVVPPQMLKAHRDDLFQAGAEGLIHSIQKFRPAAGVRLCSASVWWVRAYAWRWLLAHRSIVMGGQRRCQRHTGRDAMPDAQLLGDDFEEGNSLATRRSIPAHEQPEELFADAEVRRVVQDALRRFGAPERTKTILRRRMLEDPAPTLQEVGDEIGLTREAVRQQEERWAPRFEKFLKVQCAGVVA